MHTCCPRQAAASSSRPLSPACSQQYPLVEERLQEVGSRVAPVNDTVQALRDLHDYIRQDQVGA